MRWPRRWLWLFILLLSVAVALAVPTRPAPLPPRFTQVPQQWRADGFLWSRYDLRGNRFMAYDAGTSGVWFSAGRSKGRGLLGTGSAFAPPPPAYPRGFMAPVHLAVLDLGLAFAQERGVGIWDFAGNRYHLNLSDHPGPQEVMGIASTPGWVHFIYRPRRGPARLAALERPRGGNPRGYTVRSMELPVVGEVAGLTADPQGQLWMAVNAPQGRGNPILLQYDPATGSFQAHHPFPDHRAGDPPLWLAGLQVENSAAWGLLFAGERLVGVASMPRDGGAGVVHLVDLPLKTEKAGAQLVVTPDSVWFSVGLRAKPWQKVIPRVWQLRLADGVLVEYPVGPPQRGRADPAILEYDVERLWVVWGDRVGVRQFKP